MKKITSALQLLLASFLVQGCLYSYESDVLISAEPKEDDEYAGALDDAARSREIYKDWESRFRVTAIYLSPKFRNAINKRTQRVYLKSSAIELSEAQEKAGFFVIIGSPNEEATNLRNSNHWNLLLKANGGVIRNPIIERLRDKERWRGYFPQVSPWTEEYLVIFDSPSVDPNSPELVEKTAIELILANADAQLKLKW